MSAKRIAIVQSNYLPWKGYFDLIAYVDEFVLFDDFQYTKRSWRNRNLIKTPQGLSWLTVPVAASPQRSTRIKEVAIASPDWAEQHLKTLRMAYRRAPYFAETYAMLEEVFLERHGRLSELNEALIRRICASLGIATPIRTHRDYEPVAHRQLRLRDICNQARASVYVSGPAAKCYLDEALMQAGGVSVEWFDYSGYSPYSQLWGPFVHEVSIVDLLFNHGPCAKDYLKFASRPMPRLDEETVQAPLLRELAA